jgi:DNA mismatch repair protein MutL
VSRHGTDTPAIGWGQAEAARTEPADTTRGTGRALPALRILGQLAATYILAEGPEGLYLIDQHAAHERILFEKLLAQYDAGGVASQALLDPVSVDVPADAVALLDENSEALRQLGFEIDQFGGASFLVRAVPQLMAQDDIPAMLRDIAAQLESGDAPLRGEIEARVLRRVCKRMAIKAGRVLSFPEMQALVRDLEACESPRTCPHGRPTIIQIGMGQLEREFGRLGA